MRVLVTGATGLVGSAVVARLRQEGHEVVAVVRRRTRAAHRLPTDRFVELDIAKATAPEHWRPHLGGIDGVVNCAGVFQDNPGDSTAGVHQHGVAALFAACEQARVRRVVHFSAIGVDRDAPTEFSRTKLRGDEALEGRDLDWVILRPSVIVGRPAYGGSALFRGLAVFPILPMVRETGPLQIVQLDDVARTVPFVLRPEAPSRKVLELAGPDRLSMTSVVQSYRGWLGLRPARLVHLPGWVETLMFGAGDLLGLLGWRPPMRTTARREIARGAVGDPTDWMRITGIAPRALDAALAAEPASVQEHWFARLYFLKPIVVAALSLFWLITGVISVGPGYSIGTDLMRRIGAEPAIASLVVLGGGILDAVIGIGIAFRRTARAALWAALAVCAFYLIVGTFLAPDLWIEPLGPLLKIGPIAALILVALAILDDR